MKRMVISCMLMFVFATGMSTVGKSDDETFYAGDFLHMGVGARALAMGGAFASVADDVTSIYWNPAGLASIDRLEASFMHSSLYGLDGYNAIMLSSPVGGFGKLGFYWFRLGVDDIQYTRVPQVLMPAGVFNRPHVESSFSTAHSVYSLSYATDIWRGLTFGVTGKFVYISSIWGYNSVGVGGDFGLIYRHGGLQIGGTMHDFTSTKLFWNTIPTEEAGRSHVDVVDPILRIGCSYGAPLVRLKSHLIGAVELDLIYGNIEKRLGFEWSIADTLALRFGLQEVNDFEPRTDLSAGAGLKIGFTSGASFSVDYAFLASELGNNNRVSVSVRM